MSFTLIPVPVGGLAAKIAFACVLALLPTTLQAADFARGADVGWLTQMEASGVRFFDASGTQKDCLQILQECGMNSIRLRVWVNPAGPNGGWNGQADVVNKAVRAKNLGYRIMLDFHYSDSWADPGQQTKPAAWSSNGFSQLLIDVSNHTTAVLDALKSAGVTPEWVQIGNETNNGMLWEDGRATTSMANFAGLVTSGHDAVKAVFPNAKVIVHISNGYDAALFRWMFDGLTANGAKYDVIGLSLYPSTSNWATLNDQCLTNMNDLVARYGKDVMVAEVGMDVNSPAIAQTFLTDIIAKTKSVSGGKGLGVFYWEPEAHSWQGYSKGAFGSNGRPTIALDAFRLDAASFLSFPTSIAVDGSGALFVGDAGTNTIQKITPNGTISLMAGTSGTSGTTDGSGATARFNQPGGLALLADGTLIVADTANATLRSIKGNGAVTTLAGSPGSRGNTDGTGAAATFSSPLGIARGAGDIVYVADALNHTIRKVLADGAVTTVAGGPGSSGFSDGAGATARFNNPGGVAVDSTGNVYVADTTNNLIRKVTSAGVVTTVAGVPNVAGSDDGTGSGALFNHPGGLAADAAGNLYLADTGNSTIRKITPTGVVTTLAGVPTIAGSANGAGSSALFNHPQAVSVDGSGNLYVADTGNAAIRKIDANRNVSTLTLVAEATPAPSTPPTPAPTPTPTPSTPTPSGGGGGGGAVTPWFLATLALLGLARRRFRPRH